MKNFRQILYVVLFSMLALLFFPMMVKAGPYHTGNYTLAATTPSPDSGDGATRNEKEIYIDAKSDTAQWEFRNLKELNVRIDNLWKFIRWGLSFLCAFGAISSFFILTKSFLQLSWLPDHPAQRRKVYVDILTSSVCTILFGGLATVMTIFYKSFEELVMSKAIYSRDYKSAFALFIVEYKYMIAGADAILTLTLIIILIKDILELATSGGNPRKREEAIRSLLFTIAGIVGCGAVGLLVGIASGILV